jgi:hypothetical protein
MTTLVCALFITLLGCVVGVHCEQRQLGNVTLVIYLVLLAELSYFFSLHAQLPDLAVYLVVIPVRLNWQQVHHFMLS